MSYMFVQRLSQAMLVACFFAWGTFASADEVDVIESGIKAVEAGNYAEAVNLFKPLAEKGSAEAQHNLAMLYRSGGHGIEKNLEESAKWFRLAADQGVADAQYYLGYMYDTGEGLQQDPRYAYVWYRKAAEQGQALAQINLGILYANGLGVKQDVQEAYLWFHVAATQGYDIALENKKVIEEALTPDELTPLQEKATEYFRKYVLPYGRPISPHSNMGHAHDK